VERPLASGGDLFENLLTCNTFYFETDIGKGQELVRGPALKDYFKLSEAVTRGVRVQVSAAHIFAARDEVILRNKGMRNEQESCM
jgi:hypothetical protein